LTLIQDGIASLDVEADNTCCLQQHQEELHDLKKDLGVLCDNLLAMSLEDQNELLWEKETLGRRISDCSLCIKKLLYSPAEHGTPVIPSAGVKLPKMDVPTLNGDLLN